MKDSFGVCIWRNLWIGTLRDVDPGLRHNHGFQCKSLCTWDNTVHMSGLVWSHSDELVIKCVETIFFYRCSCMTSDCQTSAHGCFQNIQIFFSIYNLSTLLFAGNGNAILVQPDTAKTQKKSSTSRPQMKWTQRASYMPSRNQWFSFLFISVWKRFLEVCARQRSELRAAVTPNKQTKPAHAISSSFPIGRKCI